MSNANTSAWKAWAALVRLPNVFTVIADVTAAFCLVLGGNGYRPGAMDGFPFPTGVFGLAIASGISLYWGGMVLNDVFDVKHDIRARRGRPLTTRAISVGKARIVGISLLALGVLLALVIGLAGAAVMSSWVPAMVSGLLVIAIVLYNGPLKRTPVAPVLMGACRVLSFLLGATAAHVAVGDDGNLAFADLALGRPVFLEIRAVALMFALGMGTYIAGITTFGRRESIGDRTIHLPIGLVTMFIGSTLIATAPYMGGTGAEGGTSWRDVWQIDPVLVFPAAIFLMVAATLINGRRAALKPSPQSIQGTIRSGLLAIIPIAAAITMLALGAVASMGVFALMFPSAWLSKRFRMT